MRLEIVLKDRKTGTVGRYVQDRPFNLIYDREVFLYDWGDGGNHACDCVRADYLGLEDVPCGHERIVIVSAQLVDRDGAVLETFNSLIESEV